MTKIAFNRFRLENGLTIIHNFNDQTRFVVVGVLYKVGSKNELVGYTGLAHLLEHLMFTGSKNVKHFDKIISQAGGENNAFTSNDITYYYISLPYQNAEVALFVEADRMQNLLLKNNSINVQKNVVIEEFKQYYLNRPYGDVEHLIRRNLYSIHPYRWPTIGDSIEDIKNITKKEIVEFYNKWYSPDNCIISISGNIDFDTTKKLVEKYFGKVTQRNKEEKNNITQIRDPQTPKCIINVRRKVPQPAIYLACKTTERNSFDYYCLSIISFLLSEADSSILYQNLVRKKKIFSEIGVSLKEHTEQGFIVIGGKYYRDYSPDNVLNCLMENISLIKNISDFELQKVKNKIELYYQTELININNVTELLAYYEYLSDANLINKEIEYIKSISINDILNCFSRYFENNNIFVLNYLPE
ncbi:MAG: insulinase family protein [Bacteroidales bacterium]|nr:insulinase family protein [Bacteroidales bacterium]